jgi:hypothetical protein
VLPFTHRNASFRFSRLPSSSISRFALAGLSGPRATARKSVGINCLTGIVKLRRYGQTRLMKFQTPSYRGYRFPPDIISHAVWLYYRFCLSFRDVEDLLSQRGITVSFETIQQWCLKFGAEYARALRRRQGRLGDIWHLDELFVNILGQKQYLWRAVDQAIRGILECLELPSGAPPISAAVDEREQWDPHFPLERCHVRRLNDVFVG